MDVGLLTLKEAVKLLLETAKLEFPLTEDDEANDESRREPPKQAVAICELCGLLPLTVAIAGGVVMNHGGLDSGVASRPFWCSAHVTPCLNRPGLLFWSGDGWVAGVLLLDLA